MTIENVGLMKKCYCLHLHVGTARIMLAIYIDSCLTATYVQKLQFDKYCFKYYLHYRES